MKNTLLLSVFAVLSIAFLFFGNASGPGQVQGLDRTGSPLSPGSCNTTGCHTGNAFEPSVEAVLLDGMDTVEVYEPGQTYTFKFSITAGSGEPSAYGFQAVALSGDNDVQAGTWSDLPDGIQSTNIDNRDYVEQSEPSETNTFEVSWTAPESDIGEVRFYAAGNAVNRDFTNNGDGAMALSSPLTINSLSTGIFEADRLEVQLSAFPNPVVDQLQLDISGAEPGNYQLSIVDLSGRALSTQSIQLPAGSHRQNIRFTSLPDGHYFLRLSDGRRVAAVKVLKK